MFEGDGVLRPAAAKATERKSCLCWNRLSQDDMGRLSAWRWFCVNLLSMFYIVDCVLSRCIVKRIWPLYVCRVKSPRPAVLPAWLFLNCLARKSYKPHDPTDNVSIVISLHCRPRCLAVALAACRCIRPKSTSTCTSFLYHT